jgi:ketosteroid isomerase-like protein
MMRFALLSAALLLPVAALADDPDPKRLAQDLLDKGAALFDARDAAKLAATYTEDAELCVVGKDQESGIYRTQSTRGRQAIERAYQTLFKDGRGETKSRNQVEFAHLVEPDLLLIHGHFQPDTNREDKVPFVQLRTKRDDKWLLMGLQLFIVPGR